MKCYCVNFALWASGFSAALWTASQGRSPLGRRREHRLAARLGFLGRSDEGLTRQGRRREFSPWVRKGLWRGDGSPPQGSCPASALSRGACGRAPRGLGGLGQQRPALPSERCPRTRSPGSPRTQSGSACLLGQSSQGSRKRLLSYTCENRNRPRNTRGHRSPRTAESL